MHFPSQFMHTNHPPHPSPLSTSSSLIPPPSPHSCPPCLLSGPCCLSPMAYAFTIHHPFDNSNSDRVPYFFRRSPSKSRRAPILQPLGNGTTLTSWFVYCAHSLFLATVPRRRMAPVSGLSTHRRTPAATATQRIPGRQRHL